MRIQHNASALNSNRILNSNNKKLGKILEKLSSGYLINRSADNAAGLAVSEKMRSMIRGLDRAVRNSQEAVTLVQTAEGALQEVESMLQRMRELSVQSANGSYTDDVDRAALQLEFEQIQDEIDLIASRTDFNGMMLFDGTGGVSRSEIKNSIVNDKSDLTLGDLLSDESGELKNIIYTETVYDFETTQTNAGSANSFGTEYQAIADELRTSIVPQVVNSVMSKYTAFNYLSGSSIGIGLKLYSDPSSSTLAAVAMSTAYSHDGAGNYEGKYLAYSLEVNTAKVDLNTAAGRSALEQTIAHEMIHAFMDEAATAGMTGITQSGVSSDEKFPGWFIEGMAQTASGPGNWTRGVSLGLTESSTASEITAALSGSNALSTNSTAAQYGTGYLASMYLGYLAAGADANMSNSTSAASDIVSGVSTILSKLINGSSLDSVINDVTGGKYASADAFEQGFASDSDAIAFVQELLQYTSDDPLGDGNVGGGLLSGDLADTDPVADSDISGLKLFALNTGNTSVKNEYPDGVTVLSGGTKSSSGTAPVTGVIPPQTPTVTYPSGVFTVTGGTEGVDWEFDTDTGTLNILSDAALTVSGGKLTDNGTTYYGNIVIADGVDAKLNLSDIDIDASKKTGNIAGISIGEDSDVLLNVTGTVSIKGGGSAAGIQLNDNDAAARSSLTVAIQDTGKLDVTGGTSGSQGGAAIGAGYGQDASASDIQINGSGILNANGGYGSAAIGASGKSGDGGDVGNITIHGMGGTPLTVNAVGGEHGAGIGGGWYGNAGDISISGKVDIDASSKSHGTGIGGGCHGEIGNISVGDINGNDSDVVIVAKGGDDGAAIGAGWDGKVGDISILSGTITATAGSEGAGIGSGYQAEAGAITISGGSITAKGSTNASGIGSGRNGTITGVAINGGEISADGGWTNDGGNIGGYTDASGTNKATVTIGNPSGVSIKAGSGEGKYITTGAKDSGGNTLYALDVSYLDDLLSKGQIPLTADGSDPASLSYPLFVEAVGADGTTYTWDDLQHMSENSAYIWMKAQDVTITFTDADGTTGSVDLRFFDDYGMWRSDEKDLPAEKPKEPGYSITTPTVLPDDGDNLWVMQVGPRTKDTFLMDIGRMNTVILGVDKGTVNIKTQREANITIDVVETAINKVSHQRANIGAYQNRLEHKIENLTVTNENMQASESAIRDADMAALMVDYAKSQILSNSAQAMLAQANNLHQGILSLLN